MYDRELVLDVLKQTREAVQRVLDRFETVPSAE